MSELSNRARELAEQMGGQDHGEEFSFPSMVNLKVIEQGLMRERRLAMEEAAKIAEKYKYIALRHERIDGIHEAWSDGRNGVIKEIAAALCAAAEREK